MKLCLKIFSLVAASLSVSVAQAQSLNEKLVAEDPNQLAVAARRSGDVVRGAILFHQGNINCAKCHRPSAETARIGPDLSRLDREVTDALIIESILQPSKSITKGFETVNLLNVDGQLISGIIVEKNANDLTLRDSQNIDRLITIPRADVDEIRSGTKSSMPDGLVNELKNRQQFLDLIRYVIEVRERGPGSQGGVASSVVRRQLSPELRGLVLIRELNCVACHQTSAGSLAGTAGQAPNLNWSGKWVNPKYLSHFIADPIESKPGTNMPRMLHQLDSASRDETAEAITHYLASIGGNQFQDQPIDAQAVADGSDLFHSVGCVACHNPRNDAGLEQSLGDSVPLGDLAGKYNVEGLVEFLENPQLVRPSGRMPNMQLTHWQARDIANYLLQNPVRTGSPWEIDSKLAEKGELLFSKLNCGSCHANDRHVHQPANPLRLEQLNSDRGCLSDKKGNWPDFQIGPDEKQLIRAALQLKPMTLSEEQQIAVSLTSLNCIACHDRNGLGGVSADRNPYFQTTNMNLGDQGRIPPTLNGVGAKLNRKWMRDVLVNGRVIRPYMKTRMPQFGEANVGHLVELLQKIDQLSGTEFALFNNQKEMRKLGLELAGNKGLNCVACHTYKYKLSDTMPAVDLTEMAERLKKEWFYQYMLDPQHFSPNTVMPSFWPGGLAIRKDIEGDPAFQIEALWQYLIDGRQAGTPSGVVREPLEIVVEDEVQMLRRNYPGIGKRGIGVGYPGGVNLAFDAEQLRLALIWKGKFVDPVAVWTGQGSGNVQPLGKTISFPRGPELNDASSPWQANEDRPIHHHFKGYHLDALRRPTFRYRFENVDVRDFFTQIIDEASHQAYLRRTITFLSTNGRDKLRFRVATAPAIIEEGHSVFLIDNLMSIRVIADSTAQIVDVADQKQLHIPLSLRGGEQQNLVLEYIWK